MGNSLSKQIYFVKATLLVITPAEQAKVSYILLCQGRGDEDNSLSFVSLINCGRLKVRAT